MANRNVRKSRVKEGLECCAHRKDFDACNECPYFSGCETEYGAFAQLASDALNMIQAYEAELNQYAQYFRQQGITQPPD